MDALFLAVLLFVCLGTPALAAMAPLQGWSWPRRITWFAAWVALGWAITFVSTLYWMTIEALNTSWTSEPLTSGADLGEFGIAFEGLHGLHALVLYAGWMPPTLVFLIVKGGLFLASNRKKSAA